MQASNGRLALRDDEVLVAGADRSPATPAVMQIQHDRPDVAVEVLPPGSPFTPGFNVKRVRVFIDYNGIVALMPMIG
ncbi:hypothetical protein EJB05_09691, partial [Eragrostis curvula]